MKHAAGRSPGSGARALAACLALLPAALAWGWTLQEPANPGQPDEPGPGDDPAWSVQLHLHGPFSEGEGSIDSHSYEGREVGVDALWWTEHDYRLRSFHMLWSFDFDTVEAPLHEGEDWAPIGAFEARRTKRLEADGRTRPEAWSAVADGDRTALELRGPARVELVADGSSLNRCLAVGLELELWVRVAALPPGWGAAIELVLSEHAPDEERGYGLESHRLRYSLRPTGPAAGDTPPAPPRTAAALRTGATLEIPIELAADEWTRLVLPISADVAAGFAPLVDGDNALRKLGFLLEADAESVEGARPRVLFDQLRLRHARPADAMYATQGELLEEVGAHHPGLAQLQGVELSMVTPHLNAYLPSGSHADFGAPDYGALIAASAPEPVDRLPDLGQLLAPGLVDAVHERGGLVSVNHMFGASWGLNRGKSRRSEVLNELLEAEVYGADLIEVGYRARGGHGLEEHLWVWDRLAREGYPLVGTGVSDSHGGDEARWRTARNNFVSWVLAPSLERDQLLAGLRRGRVFFGDLTLFDGRLDLLDERAFRMGQVVLTDREQALVELSYDGARAGDRAVPVIGGKAGEPQELEGPSGRVAVSVPLHPEQPTVVRFELHGRGTLSRGASGPGATLRAATNPIVYARGLPASPAGERVGVDLGGFALREVRGFELDGCRLEAPPSGLLELTGRADDGLIRIEAIGATGELRVELDGLEGTLRRAGGDLLLVGLRGTGRILVSRAR